MIHSFRIPVQAEVQNQKLIDTIESLFVENDFRVQREDCKITFERLILQDHRDGFHIMDELFEGFTRGIIYIEDASPKELVCKIYYFRLLMVSIMIGFLICIIFYLYLNNFTTALTRVGMPVSLFFVVMGVKTGNAQVKDLLIEAVK